MINYNTWKTFVDDEWDEVLTVEEKEKIIKSLTGHGSHFNMTQYTKTIQQNIRDKMVEMNMVKSLEEINNDD